MEPRNNLKKEKERGYAELFFKIMGFKGKLQENPCDPPDFVIRENGVLLGLELTSYTGEETAHGHKGGSKKTEAQAIWKKIVDDNRESFLESINKPVNVYIIPKNSTVPPKSSVTDLLDELRDLVNGNPAPAELMKISPSRIDGLLNEYLSLILIGPAGNIGPRLEVRPGAESIGARPVEFKNIINEKAVRCAKINGAYDCLMLLIHPLDYAEVGDLRLVAHIFEREAALLRQVGNESPFDRIFLLSQLFGDHLMELYPMPGRMVYDENPIDTGLNAWDDLR